jgi:hypothetical protein
MGIGNIIGNIKEKFNQAGGLKGLGKTILVGNPKVTNFVMPVSMSGAGSAIKSGVTGVKNFITRQTTNPFKGVSWKEGFSNAGKNLAGSTIQGAKIAAASSVGYSVASGKPLTFANVVEGAKYGFSAGLSPFGAVLGVSTAYLEKGKDKIEQIRNNPQSLGKSQIGVNDSFEAFNTELDWFKSQASKLADVQGFQPMGNINISPPSTVVNLSSPSPNAGFGFSPSVSMGGGMGEILPLMLLLGAGAGFAGYQVGKRKKKKYKRKNKRK